MVTSSVGKSAMVLPGLFAVDTGEDGAENGRN